MKVLNNRYPNAIYVFEDFHVDKGLNIINRYKNKFRVFNECISGTAGLILSGIFGSLRI